MFDYKLIEALAMVVERGGFEKASKALNITQSAISQRVRLLEEYSGQVLISRTSPPVPTSTGKKFLAHYLQVKHLETQLLPTIQGAPQQEFTKLALGVNADSLATWFLDAVKNQLASLQLTLDIYIDDQEQTLRLLQSGQVCGCITTHDKALQGCRVEKLGSVAYGLYSSRKFANQWFKKGVSIVSLSKAPTIRFNSKDNLNSLFFSRFFQEEPENPPTFFVPSSETFLDFIVNSFCYGIVPQMQLEKQNRAEHVIDLMPSAKIHVPLYFHCWNLRSSLLDTFTTAFITAARDSLLQT